MQYLKTLKEFQNLLSKFDYERDVTKQLKSLKEEKVLIMQNAHT